MSETSLVERKKCPWEGNDLMQHVTRGTGKERTCCDLACVRAIYVEKKKLDNFRSRIPSKKPWIDQYVMFADSAIEKGYPIIKIRDQLKKVRKGDLFETYIEMVMFQNEQTNPYEDMIGKCTSLAVN